METLCTTTVPRFVVVEGVDDAGKTTLAQALARDGAAVAPDMAFSRGSFPGVDPGTPGAWVYRLRHDRVVDALASDTIAPAALQALHVSAHVDAMLHRIAPTLTQDGAVILDCYWWRTCAAGRHLSPDQVWSLVGAERSFWRDLPAPVVIDLSRGAGFTVDRVIFAVERGAGVRVPDLDNDGPLARI